MTTINSVRMPKPYLLEVLNEYDEIENNIGEIIDASGYKSKFIAQKLKMPISTFYFKRRTKSFISKEIKQIVRLIDDETDEENELLLNLAKSRRDDEKASAEDFISFLQK